MSSFEIRQDLVGRSLPRIEGPQKVSGEAKYAADHNFPGVLFAVPVSATIAAGVVTDIDGTRAEGMAGVRAIYTHETIGRFYRVSPIEKAPRIDEKRPPLADDQVRYYGQYVALLVADTLEQAQEAAAAVRVSYRIEPHDVTRKLVADDPQVKSQRGDAEAGFAQGVVRVDRSYGTPDEVHNPIETHATVAVWDGDRVTLYETSQAIMNQRRAMSEMLGIPEDQMRIITRYLGSGFGGKLWPWTHSLLAAQAARKLGRPVKLAIERKAMFSNVGHRPRTSQRVRLAASSEGKLTSLRHDYVTQASMLDDYAENCGEATPFLYSTPNLRVTAGIARKNVGPPTSMRGPGAVPGLYALESAMDELAVELRVDPVELRLRNEPAIDESLGIPFSSRHLKDCLTEGAKAFGWAERTQAVGSMRRNEHVVGWGMAAGSWIAARYDCQVAVDLRADGAVRVISATQDIGTGTYTMFAQVAGDAAGVAANNVEVVIGDSSLPKGPISGGSMVTASLIAPVQEAVAAAGRKLIEIATAKGGAFEGRKAEDLVFEKGVVKPRGASNEQASFSEILQAARANAVTGEGKGIGNIEEVMGLKKGAKLSSHSFSCQFAEVLWKPEIAQLRVSRMLAVIDAGRMINPRTARNQIEGAMVMGVGMALFEQMSFDQRSGAPINSNLADYLVTTHADAPALEVIFVEHPDYNLNPLGARGVGEIGLAGVAAAITNAVYHATGKRIRELPVRVENLL